MADFRRGIKWWLFLSSYIPLYIILIWKHRNITITFPETEALVISTFSGLEVPLVSLGWMVLSVISALFLYIAISIRESRGGTDIQEVESSKSRDDLITNYILVYIFPFVVLDYSSMSSWLAFIIFFGVIAIIQVRSNHLYVNPVLALFDYRIYEVVTQDRVLTVISKGGLDHPVDQIVTVELSNDVFLKPH